ncbi:MAG TPA: hypothetical protein VFW87_16120 [Pirellulales bacterium]|nr:hypothetical protein [Pirellulales bacterium]
MNDQHHPDIESLFADGKQIDAALAAAGREALITHKRMGYPVPLWRHGQVVWMPPEEIVVAEPPNGESS